MLSKRSTIAVMMLLVFGGLMVRATASAQGDPCTYEAWGHVSGGHYDCLGTACVPSICCKICPPQQPGE
jgi:hypothetical protein